MLRPRARSDGSLPDRDAGPATAPLPPVAPARPGGRAGDLLAGRYRLERLCADRGRRSALWRAVDELLVRPVAVRLVPHRGVVDPARLVAAASRAGRALDPRLARVLDVGAATLADDEPVTFVVTEWVHGIPLVRLLRTEGPLSHHEAADLAWQVADTLAKARSVGAGHGRLHPGNVFVDRDRVVVTDLEIAATLSPEACTADGRGVGGLLYAGLTGYWPLEVPAGAAADRLPRAPAAGAGSCHPRQLRAGIPRACDAVAGRLLGLIGAGGGPPVADVGTAASMLARLPRTDPQPVVSRPPVERPLPPWRRPLLRALPLVGLVALGLVAYLVVNAATRASGPSPNVPPFSPPRTTAPAAATPFPVVGVSVYDPGGDGPENAAQATLATDGNSSTAWNTYHYIGNPVFGGLKQGVGLRLDLGAARTVHSVRITLLRPGAGLQVRADVAGTATAGDPGTYPTVASVDAAPATSTINLTTPTTARFWLVWFTRLPQDAPNDYQDGIAEVAFFG